MRLNGPAGPPWVGEKLWPLDAQAGGGRGDVCSERRGPKKTRPARGRQRGGRGVLGDFASDQAACRACEQVLDARWTARLLHAVARLIDETLCHISALSSLLMARSKDDTDKALETQNAQ